MQVPAILEAISLLDNAYAARLIQGSIDPCESLTELLEEVLKKTHRYRLKMETLLKMDIMKSLINIVMLVKTEKRGLLSLKNESGKLQGLNR